METNKLIESMDRLGVQSRKGEAQWVDEAETPPKNLGKDPMLPVLNKDGKVIGWASSWKAAMAKLGWDVRSGEAKVDGKMVTAWLPGENPKEAHESRKKAKRWEDVEGALKEADFNPVLLSTIMADIGHILDRRPASFEDLLKALDPPDLQKQPEILHKILDVLTQAGKLKFASGKYAKVESHTEGCPKGMTWQRAKTIASKGPADDKDAVAAKILRKAKGESRVRETRIRLLRTFWGHDAGTKGELGTEKPGRTYIKLPGSPKAYVTPEKDEGNLYQIEGPKPGTTAESKDSPEYKRGYGDGREGKAPRPKVDRGPEYQDYRQGWIDGKEYRDKGPQKEFDFSKHEAQTPDQDHKQRYHSGYEIGKLDAGRGHPMAKHFPSDNKWWWMGYKDGYNHRPSKVKSPLEFLGYDPEDETPALKYQEAEGDGPGEWKDTSVEIAYRIPGKGGFKRKVFPNSKAMGKWIDALIAKEGDDVEIRVASDRPVERNPKPIESVKEEINREWGFFGTWLQRLHTDHQSDLEKQAEAEFKRAQAMLQKAPYSLTAKQAEDFLNSRQGRHTADDWPDTKHLASNVKWWKDEAKKRG